MSPKALTLLVASGALFAGCFEKSGPVKGGGDPAPSGKTEAQEEASPTPEKGAPASPEGPRAAISGRVRFTGEPLPLQPVRMDADPVCASLHPGPVYLEDLVLNEDGTLRNVFVHVTSGLLREGRPPPQEAVVMDQKGCRFHPHVFGIQVRQRLEITNSDDTYHNVQAISGRGVIFNEGMSLRAKRITKSFARPEGLVKFLCSVHPWMSAYAFVLDHPFFSVTGGDGSFRIPDLPPGKYTITAWHEKLGELEQTVELLPGETKTIEFAYE